MVARRDSIAIPEVAMAQSLDEIASTLAALLRRVDALETAVKGSDERRDAVPDQMRAIDDYHRLDGLRLMEARPEWLTALRARHVAMNAYLEERGLPPRPDPYPELP